MEYEEQVEGGDTRTPGVSAATIAPRRRAAARLDYACLVMFGRRYHPHRGRYREPVRGPRMECRRGLWAWWKDNPITPKSRAQHAA